MEAIKTKIDLKETKMYLKYSPKYVGMQNRAVLSFYLTSTIEGTFFFNKISRFIFNPFAKKLKEAQSILYLFEMNANVSSFSFFALTNIYI